MMMLLPLLSLIFVVSFSVWLSKKIESPSLPGLIALISFILLVILWLWFRFSIPYGVITNPFGDYPTSTQTPIIPQSYNPYTQPTKENIEQSQEFLNNYLDAMKKAAPTNQ